MTNYTEELELYRAARVKILGGQEVTLPNGSRIRRADLEIVVAEIKRLEPLAAREARGSTGPRVRRGAA